VNALEEPIYAVIAALDTSASMPTPYVGSDVAKVYRDAVSDLRRERQRLLRKTEEEFLAGVGSPHEEDWSEQRAQLLGRLTALELQATRSGRRWRGVKVGKEYVPVQAFDPTNPVYEEWAVRSVLKQQARVRVDSTVAEAVGEAVIYQIGEHDPKVGRQLARLSDNDAIDTAGFAEPLTAHLLDGQTGIPAARKAVDLYADLVDLFMDPDELKAALNLARSREAQAKRDVRVLRSIAAEMQAGRKAGDGRVDFTPALCTVVERNGTRTKPGLTAGYDAQIRVLIEQPLFRDFLLFYEHDIPRTYGFDPDPRSEYAKAVREGTTSRLSRRQWTMLDRYFAAENAPELLADYKVRGKVRRGLITKVSERIAALADQADPNAPGRRSRKRRDAQRTLEKVLRSLGLNAQSIDREIVVRALNLYRTADPERVIKALEFYDELRRGRALTPKEESTLRDEVESDLSRWRQRAGVRAARILLFRVATAEDPDPGEVQEMEQMWRNSDFDWPRYLENQPYSFKPGALFRGLKTLVTIPSGKSGEGYQLFSAMVLYPPSQYEVKARLADAAERARLDIPTTASPDEAARLLSMRLRRERIRKFFDVARVLQLQGEADTRLLAEYKSRRFVDAEPLTAEGEAVAKLAQSLYCAETDPSDSSMVEVFLTPLTARLLADLLGGYAEYPLAVDIDDPDVLAERATEAETLHDAILVELERIFTPRGKKTPQGKRGLGCYLPEERERF
jgi:hypothetical protein